MINIFRSNDRLFTPLMLASGAVTAWTAFAGHDPKWWYFSLLGYVLVTGLGISVGYHRLLTHQSFKTYKWVEYLLAFFGAMGGTGSPIGWVAMHKMHHRHSDKELDPHSPHTGSFWNLLSHYSFKFNKWSVRHLLSQRFYRYLHEFYYLWIALYFAALALIDYRLMLFLGVIPMFILFFASAINVSLSHMWGYRNYPTPDTSTNNWFNSLFFFGEGWHNNHHFRPKHWNFGHKWWEIDLGALLVRIIKK